MAGSPTLEMPALGRPFNLGMLYDCRRDELVPGMTLWDREELERDMRETPKPNSEFDIVASDSISDKSSLLDVEASLKASFLSGLVEVEGSAKYLNDTKTSKHQARVTLKYKSTTHFRELTMNQLGRGNMKHPYVFEQGLATHVVTAILYGAQAFFVFDREVSNTENLQDIQGNLNVMIKKIPLMSIEGDGALKMKDKDKEMVDTFSCRFHGDFSLEQNPVSFKDAVKVYKDLPKLLGSNGEKAVPVKVWLLPLTSLDSAAAKVVRQISLRLIQEAENILEDFNDLEMRCNDVLKSTTAQQFPQIAQKIKTFKRLCSEFKLGLQGTLAKKLPAIREGGEDEAKLAEILKNSAASPFNSERLRKWMDCRDREVHTINSLTNMMKNTKITSQSSLNKELLSTEKAVCFVFTSLEGADPHLSALENHLKGVESDEPGPRVQDAEKTQWYASKDVCNAMRHKAKLFSDFAEANQDEDMRFLAVGSTDENHKGSTIYFYENGFQVNDNFEPPSKPEKVTEGDMKHNSVTLKISAPKSGAEAVTRYRVEYCVSGEDQWLQKTESKADEVTVTGLSPNTEYIFRVRAVTAEGHGPAAQLSASTLPEPEGPRRVTEDVRKISKVLETKSSLQILKIPLNDDQLNISGCRRLIYGQDSVKRNCTIMVMGATGAGKSTLINYMINYILGVQWSDSYRFKLVVEEEKSQTHSQTSEVTVYKINHQDGFQIDYSLTIVDTPGFGDTRGIQRDQEITEQVRNLFTEDFGVSDIHAVCFVAHSPLARLTATQRYVFDSVLSIFGHDVAENIRILVTFADGQLPPVLEAIKEAGVPCPRTEDGLPAHFKFNNSALFAQNQASAMSFDQMFWNMGNASMRSFFDALEQTEPKSLTLTKEVLRERKQLENSVEVLEKQVKIGLAKLEEINETSEQVKKHEAEIERNKDFEVKITVIKPFQEDISGTGRYITNCQDCSFTCHYPCSYADDDDKQHCCAMGSDGYCTACPGKCHWRKHYNQKYRWEYKQVTEKKTVDELKQKWMKGKEEKQTVEGFISTLKTQYNEFKKQVKNMIKTASNCINRLKEIALKPNPLSAPDYIDLLIEEEKNQRQLGWKERVESLNKMKKTAETMEKLDNGDEFMA